MGRVKEQWHDEICAENKFNLEEAEYERQQEELACQQMDFGEEKIDEEFEMEKFTHNEIMYKDNYKK